MKSPFKTMISDLVKLPCDKHKKAVIWRDFKNQTIYIIPDYSPHLSNFLGKGWIAARWDGDYLEIPYLTKSMVRYLNSLKIKPINKGAPIDS